MITLEKKWVFGLEALPDCFRLVSGLLPDCFRFASGLLPVCFREQMWNVECGIMTLEDLRTTLVIDFRLGFASEMGLGRENSGWDAWRAP